MVSLGHEEGKGQPTEVDAPDGRRVGRQRAASSPPKPIPELERGNTKTQAHKKGAVGIVSQTAPRRSRCYSEMVAVVEEVLKKGGMVSRTMSKRAAAIHKSVSPG